MNDDFEDPHKKLERLKRGMSLKGQNQPVDQSERLQETYENLKFRKKVKEKPVMKNRDYLVFGVVVSLNEFLNLRLWQRSIYVTDKLLRLVARASYEQQKKYITKKRQVPINALWIILIMIIIVVALLVILFLLPKLTGAVGGV